MSAHRQVTCQKRVAKRHQMQCKHRLEDLDSHIRNSQKFQNDHMRDNCLHPNSRQAKWHT